MAQGYLGHRQNCYCGLPMLRMNESTDGPWYLKAVSTSGHPKLSVTETPAIERLPILVKALDSASLEGKISVGGTYNRALRERTFGSVDSGVRVFN